MDQNPYRSTSETPKAHSRGVGWWLLALAAGAAIGLVFAYVALPR